MFYIFQNIIYNICFKILIFSQYATIKIMQHSFTKINIFYTNQVHKVTGAKCLSYSIFIQLYHFEIKKIYFLKNILGHYILCITISTEVILQQNRNNRPGPSDCSYQDTIVFTKATNNSPQTEGQWENITEDKGNQPLFLSLFFQIFHTRSNVSELPTHMSHDET